MYAAREDPIEGVSSAVIADRMTGRGSRVVQVAPDFDAALERVLAVAGPGDVVMTIGAGDVTMLAPMITAALSGRSAPTGEETTR